VITKGEDFVVEPLWLQGDVYQYVRGHNNGNLHTEEHGKVFEARQKRKSLKKPRPPAKNPGMSYMIPEKEAENGTKYVTACFIVKIRYLFGYLFSVFVGCGKIDFLVVIYLGNRRRRNHRENSRHRKRWP